ncbi:hypothetical protein EON77_00210 [bacterium]|nr:MAG: hypothetical protein EON77_00210 [bacterium]
MADTAPHYSNPYSDVAATAATSDRPASERIAEAKYSREGKKTGKEIMKMNVISLADGAIVGEVLDVIYNFTQGRLIAVTIPVGRSFLSGGKTLLLRTEDIYSIGEDAITIQDVNSAREIDRSAKDFGDEAGEPVLGKRLMTDDGSFLGKIDDVLIDRESRRITSYEVSGGIWNDLMRGQTDVPVEHITTIGPDVVVVPASVKHQVNEVSGGLIGTAQLAGEKIVDVKDAAAEKIGDARTAAAEKIEDKEIDYAIGKVAGADVRMDDGHFIVHQGETITEAHVQQALAANKMHALATSAGKAHAADLYDTAKEKTAAGLEVAKEKAGEAQEAFKDKQGEFLVGKTAGRDVTKTDGSVFVTGGSTITEADVATAREDGRLAELTAAVGTKALVDAKDAVAEKYDEAKTNYAQGKAEADANRADALPLTTETASTGMATPMTPGATVTGPSTTGTTPDSGTTVIHADTVIVQPNDPNKPVETYVDPTAPRAL